MKSIASAPGKIILFGEHFVVHGTKAILAAIDKRVIVTTTFTENKTIKVNSQLGTLEVPIFFGDYKKVKSEFRPFIFLACTGSVWAGLRLLELAQHHEHGLQQNSVGLEITIDSDIPIGVGLGSSSACCVAAAASIYGLIKEQFHHTQLSSEEILKISIEAEKTTFPDTSGADCAVCTYGGMIEYPSVKGTAMDTSGNGFWSTNILGLGSPYERMWGKKYLEMPIEKIDNTFDLNLLIANSMIPHNTKNSVEKVNKFKENNEDRFSQLCDLENWCIEKAIVAMKNNDATALGLKMSENQAYLEEIQVSNDTLRGMIYSLNEISLGSKITGAGDGGCIIALIKDENMDKVPALLPKDKEYFSAKIDTKGVVWSTIEE